MTDCKTPQNTPYTKFQLILFGFMENTFISSNFFSIASTFFKILHPSQTRNCMYLKVTGLKLEAVNDFTRSEKLLQNGIINCYKDMARQKDKMKYLVEKKKSKLKREFEAKQKSDRSFKEQEELCIKLREVLNEMKEERRKMEQEQQKEQARIQTRHFVLSMIHSARIAVPQVAIIIFTWRLSCFAIFWKVWTHVQTTIIITTCWDCGSAAWIKTLW